MRRIQELERRIVEARQLIGTTRFRLREYLREIQKVSISNSNANQVSLLEIYKMFIQKEKCLYITLNKLKREDKLYQGYCWIPKLDNKRILGEIEGLKEKNKNIEMPTMKVVSEHGVRPPSLFRMNEFTWVFQEIVNTYGIPTYKEVNPAVFAIVTFPFLFGIMFGDIAHGGVLFLVGAILCLFSEQIKRKAPGMEIFLSLRYMILLMGLFAAYCGFIYNDFMAIPVWFFDSCYDLKEIVGPDGTPVPPSSAHPHRIPVSAELKPDCTYPIGIDPTWFIGTNFLTFLNSLKMKLSVILGIMQMSLGICMKAFNAAYFKNKLDFFYEFVPQIILMLCLFGFMDWLIIAKWLTDFTGKEHTAPSIISTMIGMALNGGTIDAPYVAVIGSNSFQQGLSIFLLLVALICVPIMLFPKPLIINKQRQEHAHHEHNKNNI